jgi:hypothetical protein
MPDARRTTAGIWSALLLAALIFAYPLSFGPACWMVDRDILDPNSIARFYDRLFRIMPNDHISDALYWYGGIGCNDSFTMLAVRICMIIEPESSSSLPPDFADADE